MLPEVVCSCKLEQWSSDPRALRRVSLCLSNALTLSPWLSIQASTLRGRAYAVREGRDERGPGLGRREAERDEGGERAHRDRGRRGRRAGVLADVRSQDLRATSETLQQAKRCLTRQRNAIVLRQQW